MTSRQREDLINFLEREADRLCALYRGQFELYTKTGSIRGSDDPWVMQQPKSLRNFGNRIDQYNDFIEMLKNDRD